MVNEPDGSALLGFFIYHIHRSTYTKCGGSCSSRWRLHRPKEMVHWYTSNEQGEQWKSVPVPIETLNFTRLFPNYMYWQEALDSFACPDQSKIIVFPTRHVISFFLNISRTFHWRARGSWTWWSPVNGPQLFNGSGGSANVSITNRLLFR